MKNKKKLLFAIVLQLAIIAYLVFNTNHQTHLKTKIIGIKNRLLSKNKSINRKPGDPLKHFYEPAPNSQISGHEWLEEKVTYTINSDTLNERFDYSPEKPKNTFRIITLGDSFTFGETANTSDNYPETLEKLLQKKCQNKNKQQFEVINLGVGGYDIEYAIKRFEKRGKKYNPDLILWYIVPGDFTEVQELKQPFYKKNLKAQIEYKKDPTLKNFRKLKDSKYQTHQKYHGSYKTTQLIAYSTQALSLIKKHYSNKLVFFSPQNLRAEAQKNLLNFSQTSSTIYFTNSIQDFEIDTSPKLFSRDGHPNKLGYQKIAQNLLKYLKTNNLTPCKP